MDIVYVECSYEIYKQMKLISYTRIRNIDSHIPNNDIFQDLLIETKD